MRNQIFLIGFMGSGKTYWGRRLSAHFSAPFIDLDEIIEETAGRSIPEIFDTVGESGFRQLESDCLKNLSAHPPSVVACGGGTPCFFDNLAWMKRHGTTIYLKSSPDIVLKRLLPERAHRPLLAGLSDPELEAWIRQRLDQRSIWYEQCEIILEYEAGCDEIFWENLKASIDC